MSSMLSVSRIYTKSNLFSMGVNIRFNISLRLLRGTRCKNDSTPECLIYIISNNLMHSLRLSSLLFSLVCNATALLLPNGTNLLML